MLTKIELQEKFRAKAVSFTQQKNLPDELKPLIAIANQVSNSKGMSVEYPIIVKDQESMSSFIELSGFIAINQDYVRNVYGKIITRLKVCYLLDIDIDIKNFKLEWLKDDEYIHVYFEKN
jgi:carbamoylphosphate synthase large subunit